MSRLTLCAVGLAVILHGQAWSQNIIPDPGVTPGAINPDVTQENIGDTICARGWTRMVRPPSSIRRPSNGDWSERVDIWIIDCPTTSLTISSRWSSAVRRVTFAICGLNCVTLPTVGEPIGRMRWKDRSTTSFAMAGFRWRRRSG